MQHNAHLAGILLGTVDMEMKLPSFLLSCTWATPEVPYSSLQGQLDTQRGQAGGRGQLGLMLQERQVPKSMCPIQTQHWHSWEKGPAQGQQISVF